MTTSRTTRALTAALTTAALLAPAVALAPSASAATTPTSCADVRAADPAAPDGTYTIVSNGVTVDVMCVDMAYSPREYLVLPAQGGGANASEDVNAFTAWDQTIRATTFTAIRLVLPQTPDAPFTVQPWDTTFATTTPQGYSAGWATAYSQGASAPAIHSNVDLTGTPFSLDPAQFAIDDADGMGVNSTVTATSDHKVIDIVVGAGAHDFVYLPEPVVLTVDAQAPSVLTQPTSTSAVVGGTATFAADFAGVPAPTVVWETRPDADAEWTPVEGATSETLTIEGVTLDLDGHLYRAIGTNTSGAPAFTIDVSLTVTTEAPAFTAGPQDTTVTSGQDATFSATVTGAPAPTLQWQTRPDADAAWVDVDGATGASLTLPAVTTADRGTQVRVVATNVAGEVASAAATLAVTGTVPQIINHPQDTTVVSGQDATFTVEVAGDPTPTVQWQYWEGVWPNQGWWDVEGATGTTLTLEDVTLADSGRSYLAVVTNDAGSVASAYGTVTVTASAPTVVEQPSDLTVATGEPASFSVVVAGDPMPWVTWQQLVGDEWISIASGTTLDLGAVTTAYDGMVVRAVATSDGGTVVSESATLTVEASLPYFTQSPQSTSVGAGRDAWFGVAVGGDPTPTIQWQTSTDDGTTWVDVADATGPELWLEDVTPDQDGLRVRAVLTNEAGTVASAAAFLWVTGSAFDDVPWGTPFYTDIQWLAERELAFGTETGAEVVFRPAAAMSRQAMAAFLYRYAGDGWTPEEGTQSFPDVDASHPFYVAIEWMHASGLAEGYIDGEFKGTAPVSRQAMAAFLFRLAGNDDVEEILEEGPFTDVPLGHEFLEEILWLAQTEITTGYSDGTFRGEAPITRQAMAAFLHRYDGLRK